MYADMWHTQHGSLEKIQASDAVLRARCAAVGRDPAAIERLASKWVTVRDDPDEARHELEASLRFPGVEGYEPIDPGGGNAGCRCPGIAGAH